MSLVLKSQKPPLREDETGAIRVGNSRVLLEIVIRAFQDGASAESIVDSYPTLTLSDAYGAMPLAMLRKSPTILKTKRL